MKFFVYMIYNIKHDKFYIGHTNNLRRRIEEHNSSQYNKYTSKYDGGWILVFREDFEDRESAKIRENFLKRQKNKNFYKKLCRDKFLVG